MLCSVSAPERKRIKSLRIMLIDGAVAHDIYPKRNCVWLILLLQNKFKSLKYFFVNISVVVWEAQNAITPIALQFQTVFAIDCIKI